MRAKVNKHLHKLQVGSKHADTSSLQPELAILRNCRKWLSELTQLSTITIIIIIIIIIIRIVMIGHPATAHALKEKQRIPLQPPTISYPGAMRAGWSVPQISRRKTTTSKGIGSQ